MGGGGGGGRKGQKRSRGRSCFPLCLFSLSLEGGGGEAAPLREQGKRASSSSSLFPLLPPPSSSSPQSFSLPSVLPPFSAEMGGGEGGQKCRKSFGQEKSETKKKASLLARFPGHFLPVPLHGSLTSDEEGLTRNCFKQLLSPPPKKHEQLKKKPTFLLYLIFSSVVALLLLAFVFTLPDIQRRAT